MSALFNESTWLICLPIFLGGFLGSPHCLAMCGPIAMNFSRKKTALLMYHLGRLISYGLLGALFGAFGNSLFEYIKPPWFFNVSLSIICIMLLYTGYRIYFNKNLHFPMPVFFKKMTSVLWKYFLRKNFSENIRGLVVGLMTALIPCGHLYSFFIGAIATGSAIGGALFMFAFWLGSLPVLSAGDYWFQRFFFSGTLPRRRIAGILLVAAGLFSIITFSANSEALLKQLPKAHSMETKQPQMFCH